MQYNNKNLNIRINDKLLNRIHENAKRLGMSDSVFIRKALINFCKYFEKMPLTEFEKYVKDPVLAKHIKEMVEIAQTPWVDINNE